jgi:predicted NodU family carbamoyl transferase
MVSISFGDTPAVLQPSSEPVHILGLPGSGHDSAVALMRVSEHRCQVLAMVEEERWTLRKHGGTRSPLHAVCDVLRIARLPVQSITCLAVGWDLTRYAGYREEYFKYRRLFADCDPEQVRAGFGCRHLPMCAALRPTLAFRILRQSPTAGQPRWRPRRRVRAPGQELVGEAD